jgi:hypothetical protein
MKSRSHFQQTPEAAAEAGPPRRRFGHPGEELQQCALAGAIASNDPDSITAFEFEGDILQSPDHVLPVAWISAKSAEWCPGGLRQDIAQCLVSRLSPDAVALA